MADAIRFYLDQHQSNALAAGLRARGIDVLTAHEAGRCGMSDSDQLAFATAEGRVVVTLITSPSTGPVFRTPALRGVRHESTTSAS